MELFRKLLAHPLTRDLPLDDPRTTSLRRQIIETKPFLLRIYRDWYEWLNAQIPAGSGPVLELGSGGGFLSKYVPGLITSDILLLPDLMCVLDGERLPFEDGSLKAIVMSNVLHHIPHVRKFFAEAERCLRPGGVVALIEPWMTWWSRQIYGRFHHEPCDPTAKEWEFPSTGPLSSANEALAWICLVRDRSLFESQFPGLNIEKIEPILALRYMLSGGVAMHTLLPEFAYRPLGWLESTWPINRGAMFARLLLRRR